MITKREKQLAKLLLKERLEHITGKKVILKENENTKTLKQLAIEFIHLNIESIKSGVSIWKSKGLGIKDEDDDGNTMWDFVYEEINRSGKIQADTFLRQNGYDFDKDYDAFDDELFHLYRKLLPSLYKQL